MLTMTDRLWADLRRINHEVNLKPFKFDIDRYQKPEFWTRIDNHGGDCEDFVLEKRHRLLQAGVPLSALKIAICTTETGEMHAVLAIDTDRGTYVLDNRHKMVKAWGDLPYKWLMRQSGRNWVAIA